MEVTKKMIWRSMAPRHFAFIPRLLDRETNGDEDVYDVE